MSDEPTRSALESENTRLRERLADAEAVIRAIEQGEIDAVIVRGPDQERVVALEGADHPYRVLVESMSEGAATLSQNGLILYANPKLATMLETTSVALAGTNLSDWADPEDKDVLTAMYSHCSGDFDSGEVALVGAAGARLPVHASFSRLPLEGKNFCCAIISDQRLAKHHEALEAAAIRIREANDKLRQADQRKDAFLATLAHELRNPLAPIRAAAHYLGSLHIEDDRHLRSCHIIERQVSHMTRLVDDLLEVSRITLGRLHVHRRLEDLKGILASVADNASSSPGLKHELKVDIATDELPMQGDAVRLSQAISNVIDNAMKYTPERGRIELSAKREDEWAVIRVTDTGIGFSSDSAAEIFEMFSQANRAHSSGNGGLGIGLALTRSIVELHGGTIEGKSAGPGKGSEFVIRLPLDTARQPVAARIDDAQEQARPQSILIVDDNVDAAESLSMLLEMTGHTAKAVHTGEAVQSALDSFSPDLILLDIGLPDMDGYEVARRLKARFGDACPKLVALSGYGRDEDKMRAADAGIDDYLTKPVSPSALGRIVSDIAPGS